MLVLKKKNELDYKVKETLINIVDVKMTVDIMQRKEQRIQTSNFSEGTIGTRSRPRPEESSRSFGKVNKPRSIPTTMAEPRFSLLLPTHLSA